MFKKSGRLLSFLGGIVFLLLLIPAVYAENDAEVFFPEEYSNISRDVLPSIFGKCRTSFVKDLDQGGYQIVVYHSGKLYVETTDASWNVVKNCEVDLELPVWGGCYLGEEFNYVVCGQNYDSTKQDGGEVFRVIKYDKEFTRLGSVSLSSEDAFTAEPFSCGNVSVAEYENILTVYTSRLRLDGHQSNISITIDTVNMRLLDRNGVIAFPPLHTSHSLRQIVKYDGENPVYVDLSDGVPVRSVYIQDGIEDYAGAPLLKISGSYGENQTNADVSGLEVSASHYFVVGTYYTDGAQNVFLSSLHKQSREVKVQWLTGASHFSPDTYHDVRIVRLSENRFSVLWNKANTSSLCYLIIDGEGNILCPIKEIPDVLLTDCEPILSNGKILLLSIDRGTVFHNEIEDFSETGDFIRDNHITAPTTFWDGAEDTNWYQESKTEFLISTPQQLAGLSALCSQGVSFLGKTVKLVNDVFMNDSSYQYEWTPIENWEGTFHGNGYTIYNLHISENIGGLFEHIGTTGIVKAVDIAQGLFYSGGCIADVNEGTIAFCNNLSYINGYGFSDCGGICNVNSGLVYGCKNLGRVEGEDAAGIVGWNKATVSQCSNLGCVMGLGDIGGIVNLNHGWVYDCYSRGFLLDQLPRWPFLQAGGSVSGIVSAGGYHSKDVQSCYSIGTSIARKTYAISDRGAWNCYTDMLNSGKDVTFLTAEEMRTASFVEMLNQSNHSVFSAWVADERLYNNGFPITVAEANSLKGIFKILPELWLGCSNAESVEEGETQIFSCSTYYNELPLEITAADSDIVDVLIKEGKIEITGLLAGETELSFHIEESDNCLPVDYSVTITVTSAETVPPEHQYESEILFAPTCTQPGIIKYICTVCGDSFEQIIAIIGHDYVNGTCTRCDEKNQEGLMGDADGDCSLTYNDALLALRYSIGLAELENVALADVDGDGDVTYNDALTILRMSIGL